MATRGGPGGHHLLYQSYLYCCIVLVWPDWPKCEILTAPDLKKDHLKITSGGHYFALLQEVLRQSLKTHFLTGWPNHLYACRHDEIERHVGNTEINPQIAELNRGAVAVRVVNRGRQDREPWPPRPASIIEGVVVAAT